MSNSTQYATGCGLESMCVTSISIGAFFGLLLVCGCGVLIYHCTKEKKKSEEVIEVVHQNASKIEPAAQVVDEDPV